jgi:hypothetical protein
MLKKPAKVKRCSSITKKGTKCKNNAVSGGVKCSTHGGKVKVKSKIYGKVYYISKKKNLDAMFKEYDAMVDKLDNAMLKYAKNIGVQVDHHQLDWDTGDDDSFYMMYDIEATKDESIKFAIFVAQELMKRKMTIEPDFLREAIN